MSNSNFDVKGSIANFSQSCTYTDIHSASGSYSYNYACMPSNATSSSQANCIKINTDVVSNNNSFTCDYFFGAQWRNSSEYQGMTCAGNCDAPPQTQAIGAGVSTNPNAALTFAAILMMMYMMFNRHH